MGNLAKLSALKAAVKQGESLDIVVAVGAAVYVAMSIWAALEAGDGDMASAKELKDEAIATAIMFAAALRAHLTRRRRRPKRRKKTKSP